MRNAWMVMIVLGLGAAFPVRADPGAGVVKPDDVIEQIEAGKAYYRNGDFARALTELGFAQNALRIRFSNAFMATLPPPPPLWSAEKPALENGVALLGGGVMVTQRYLERKGEGKITAELMVDSPLVQAFSAVFTNPIMISSDPDLERVRLDGMTALLKWNADRRAGDISLSLDGRVLIKLIGDSLKDKTVLLDLMRAWDLEAVRDVASLR